MTRDGVDALEKAIRWTENASEPGGVGVRGFALEREGKSIPGAVWYPAAASGPRPLVLMGHGGTGHKRNDRMTMMGQLFTIPVLFMIRLQDERFEPQGQFELFDLLGTSNKRVHAHPGPHSDTGTEVFEAAADFLQRYPAPEARPSIG